MSDADAAGPRSDPRVIRRLDVIIALLVLPYVLYVVDRFGGDLLWYGVAAVVVFGVLFPAYVVWPHLWQSVLHRRR